MKIIVPLLFLFSFNTFSKCAVPNIEKFIKETPIFVEGIVQKANFRVTPKILKTNLSDKRLYPYFEINITKVLKGKVEHKVLEVHKSFLSFDMVMFPNPLNRVRNGLKRIFGIKRIKKNGRAIVFTSNCSPVLDINNF